VPVIERSGSGSHSRKRFAPSDPLMTWSKIRIHRVDVFNWSVLPIGKCAV
jgi:hypothetical protein